MKSKVLNKLALILVFLAAIGCLSFNSQKVDAATWWNNSRRAVVTWPVKAYEYYSAAPLYIPKKVKTITLRAGRDIKIRRVIHYGTLVTDKKLKYTATNNYSRFWVVPNYKDYWFDFYQKNIWIDKGLIDGKSKEEFIEYKLSWNQWKKINSLGLNYKPYKSYGNNARALIKQWGLKPHKVDK